MRAGKLTERIEIYEPDVTQNMYGEQTTEYIFKSSCRAEIVHHRNSRNTENNEIVYPNTKTIRIRRYVVISEFFRVKLHDKFYRIISNIEDNKEYQYKEFEIELINE